MTMMTSILIVPSTRLPESPDLVWERVGGELPSQHQIIRNALRIFRVSINILSVYSISEHFQLMNNELAKKMP